MRARWATFGVGIGLLLAPLVLGYDEVAPILHDVAMGVLVCVATLAALGRPRARFVMGAPAGWLLLAGREAASPAVAAVELGSGALLLVLAVFPSARLAPRTVPALPPDGSADARA
jgi:hypothetical protein